MAITPTRVVLASRIASLRVPELPRVLFPFTIKLKGVGLQQEFGYPNLASQKLLIPLTLW